MSSSVTLASADLNAVFDAANSADRSMPMDVTISDLLGVVSHLVACDLLRLVAVAAAP